jgi:Uncharacterized conserved protein
MPDEETPIADQQGRFAPVVRDGRKLSDIEWLPARLLLSDKRLVLATNEGSETIPLSVIESIRSRTDVTKPIAKVSSYLSIRANQNVTLVAPAEHGAFEQALYEAILDQQGVLIDHPAVAGGVVKESDWTKGRLTVDSKGVALATADGRLVEIEIDDVGRVEQTITAVAGQDRPVVKLEHTEDDTVVETHVSAPRARASVLASLLRAGVQTTTDADLSEAETEVVMALYSGVSPFEIPDFVGMDVDRVEKIYDRLIEAGIIERERTRREVALRPRGRHVASEATEQT